MEKQQYPLNPLFVWVAIAGNLLFVLWILYNGVNERFQGTTIEKLSYILLMGLLTLNAWLLIRSRKLSDKMA